MRRILTTSAAVLGLLCLAPALAAAQGWQPTRPIKMICPFPAGGGTDLIARIVAKQLTDRLGQQVYVENRGGANGGLGAQEVMRAEPDGYTIGAISDSPMTVNPWMYDKLAYQPLQDFIAVARINHFPSLLVAHPSVPDQDRRRPDQARQGKARHAELFLRRRRQLQPPRPGGAGLQDRHQHRARALSRRRPGDAGGRSPATCSSCTTTSRPRCRTCEAGKLTGLAVGGEQRFPALAERPDRRRDRAGLRRDAVGRHFRAGQDAEGDRRAAEQGGRRAAQGPGGRQDLRRPT